MSYRVEISGQGPMVVATFARLEDAERLQISINSPHYHAVMSKVSLDPFYSDLGHFLLDAGNGRFLSFVLPLLTPKEVQGMCVRAIEARRAKRKA